MSTPRTHLGASSLLLPLAGLLFGCGSVDGYVLEAYSEPLLGAQVTSGGITLPEGTAVGVRVQLLEDGEAIEPDDDMEYTAIGNAITMHMVTGWDYAGEDTDWRYLVVGGANEGTAEIVGEVTFFSGEARIPVTVTAQPDP